MTPRPPDLADLIARLREEGFEIGPYELRRLRTVFAAMPQASQARLPALVRTVLAKSADDAARLDEVTLAWLSEVESRLEDRPFDLPRPPAPPETDNDESARVSRAIVLGGIALGLVLAVTTMWLLFRESPKEPSSTDVAKPSPASTRDNNADSGTPEDPENPEDLKDPEIVDVVGDSALFKNLPRDFRGRPLFTEPPPAYTTWHIDRIEVSPPPPPQRPWRGLLLAALASAVLIYLLWRHRTTISVGPPQLAEPGARFVPSPSAPPPSRELLSARDAARLVAGVGHFVDENPGSPLDVSRTVAATARAAGVPQIIHENPRHLREVWLWIDDDVTDALSLSLLEQVETDLRRAGLMSRRAAFHRRPESLVWLASEDGERRLPSASLPESPYTLEGRREEVIVLVITPGRGLLEGEESALEVIATERLLRHLSSWPHLTLLQTRTEPDPWVKRPADALSRLAKRFSLGCHPLPEITEVVASDAGLTVRPRPNPLPEADRSQWLGALALAPVSFSSGEALELRKRLGLDAEPWQFLELQRDLIHNGDAWSLSDGRRARYSARLAKSPSALKTTLEFWHQRLEAQAALPRQRESTAHPWKGTIAELRWRLHVALLNLWREGEPVEAAVDELEALDRTPLRKELRSALHRRMPRMKNRARGYIMLPWALTDLKAETRSRLAFMELGRKLWPLRQTKDNPGNLGFAVGALVAVILFGIVSAIIESQENAFISADVRLDAVGFPQAVLDSWSRELPISNSDEEQDLTIDGERHAVSDAKGGSTIRVHASPRTLPSVERMPWGELWNAGVSPRLFLSDFNEKPTRIFLIEDFDLGRALGIRLLDRCVAGQVAIATPDKLGEAHQDLRSGARELWVVTREPLALSDVRAVVTTDFEALIAALDFPATRKASGFDEERIPELFRDFKVFPDLEMVTIAEGRFLMGNENPEEPNQGPTRSVALGAYGMMRHEVTRRLFKAVMGRENKVTREWSETESPLRPAGGTSWYDANRFSARLAHLLGQPTPYQFRSEGDQIAPEPWKAESAGGWRLPTEAEWERTCRAGTRAYYHWGSQPSDDYAWHEGNSRDASQPIATTRFANPWGLEDITGNVAEWCWDSLPADSGLDRVTRGGGFATSDAACGSAVRARDRPTVRSGGTGFRLVITTRRPWPPVGLQALSTNAQGFEEYLHKKSGLTLILIPGGAFTMGSADSDADGDEQPLTEVTLSPFYLAKDEVTWGHYRRFREATGRAMPNAPPWGMQDDHPVVNVSWEDAKAYCDWAGLSLPTEAQWEYAARGSEGRKWPWGDEAPTSESGHAQMEGMGGKTASVGSFPLGVGPFGHRDLAGNAWEWCADGWWDKHPGGRVSDPKRPDAGRDRVSRGGSWFDSAGDLRGSYRGGGLPSVRLSDLGFRPSLLTP